MALTSARVAPRYADGTMHNAINVPAAASQTFYLGALVCAGSTGYLVNGTAATGLTALGVFGDQPFYVPSPVYTSSGTTGADEYQVQVGTFLFLNSGSDAVTQAEIGLACYIEDNQTVCKTGTGKSLAGTVVMLNPSDTPQGPGVWVAVGKAPMGLVGSAGPTGATGATGPTGPTGPTGA